MRLVGAIPKTKGVSDSELVRWILKLRDRRGVISLFPEGQRTWDGASLPVLYSTAKLVKLLRIPVVVPVFKGGYFSHPRWAFKPRRGKLVIEFRHAFSGDELRSLSADDIHARLTALIGHDAYEHQATHMIRFRGRRPAEDIEHILFICPSCRSFATLHSRRRHVTCSACGYRLVYTDYGYLVPASGRAQHLTIRDLNRSQLEYFAGYLDGVSAETPVFSEPDTVLSTGYRTNPVHRVATGTLTLYADRILFARGGPGGVLGGDPGLGGGGRGELVFPLADIEGLNVQLTRKLELYHRGRLYTFDPTDRKCSMYKWQVAIEHLTTRQMSDAGFAG
jgi:1-acyl-sn-glycerol-3-phosphate acyltransferase